MSLEIDWQNITEDANLMAQLKDFLNTHVQNLSLPSYLSHLEITHFSLGDIPPEITIRHVGDPFQEFYQDPDSSVKTKKDSHIQFIVEFNFPSDLYLELETNLLLNYPSSNFISLPIKLKFSELFIHSLLSLTMIDKKFYISFLYDIEDGTTEESPSNDTLAMNSRSNSYMGSIPMNYNPSVPLLNFSTNSALILNSLNNSSTALRPAGSVSGPSSGLNISTGSGTGNSNSSNSNNRIDIIKKLKIESEVGQMKDLDGSILRNIGKIEKFLVELLKDLIITELAWPSWLELDFNDDDDEEEEDEEENESKDGVDQDQRDDEIGLNSTESHISTGNVQL